MSQSQENFWTEGWNDGKTEGQTGPNSLDPSGHSWGSKKAKILGGKFNEAIQRTAP